MKNPCLTCRIHTEGLDKSHDPECGECVRRWAYCRYIEGRAHDLPVIGIRDIIGSKRQTPQQEAVMETMETLAVDEKKEKQCKECGVVKKLEEFYENNNMKDGRESTCKQCRREQDRKRGAAKREARKLARAAVTTDQDGKASTAVLKTADTVIDEIMNGRMPDPVPPADKAAFKEMIQRCKTRAVPPVTVNPSSPASNGSPGGKSLVVQVNFADYPQIYEALVSKARAEMRTPAAQILWGLQFSCAPMADQ